MDAYLTALVIPAYLGSVLLAGLPFVLIPAFVREEEAGGEEEAWSLTGTIFWLTTIVLGVASIVGALFSTSLISLTAPGLSPAKADLAAEMLTILMFGVLATGLGALTRGIQNARGSFFWPAGAGAIKSATNLAVVVVLYRPLGPLALAWGFLISELCKAAITVVPVLHHGWSSRMSLGDPRLREMLRLMLPFILFGMVTHSMAVFERFFASGLPDGDLSYLGYATRLSGMVNQLIGVGVATAVFPAMARAFSQFGEGGLVDRLTCGLRLTSAVAFPALAVVSAVSVPLISVVLEGGAFKHEDTLAVSRIVPLVMMATVVCSMIGNVLTRGFYVLKDTHTVPIVRTLSIVVYIGAAMLLVQAWGYLGLAAAAPLHKILALVALFLLLARKLEGLRNPGMIRQLLVYFALSVVAFFAGRGVVSTLSFLHPLVQLIAGAAVAGLLYMSILFWLDRDMATSVLEMTGVQRAWRGAKLGFYHIEQATRG
jgi:putative peptidoglycan lipid II flippase